MKGLFIPDITSEMFRNGCLEGIEALMAEGEIYDIEYSPWIPVSIREATPEELEDNPNITFYYTGTMPDLYQRVLVTTKSNGVDVTELCEGDFGVYFDNYDEDDIVAWMPYPERYEAEVQDV